MRQAGRAGGMAGEQEGGREGARCMEEKEVGSDNEARTERGMEEGGKETSIGNQEYGGGGGKGVEDKGGPRLGARKVHHLLSNLTESRQHACVHSNISKGNVF